MELRGTLAPEWLVWMFYGTGQHVFIVAIFAVFLFTQLRHWRELPRLAVAMLRPRTLFYLGAGIVLLSSGIAEIAEHRYGMAAENFEEWLELAACCSCSHAVCALPRSAAGRGGRLGRRRLDRRCRGKLTKGFPWISAVRARH